MAFSIFELIVEVTVEIDFEVQVQRRGRVAPRVHALKNVRRRTSIILHAPFVFEPQNFRNGVQQNSRNLLDPP
jgi:hypothetical protein